MEAKQANRNTSAVSEPRDQMIAALREVVLPVLRDMGFTGSFPHFRRIRDTQIDLLTFQFNRHGGSFVVEASFCAPDGFTTSWGAHIPPKKVRAHDIHPNQRPRLDSNHADGWFHYEPEHSGIYAEAASQIVPILRSRAETYWQTHQLPNDRNA